MSLVGSRAIFLLSLTVLGGLIVSAGYLTSQQTRQVGSGVEVSRHEVARLGGRTKVSLIIKNNEGRGLNYTYFVYANVSSTNLYRFNQTVFIPNENSFRYNLYVVPEERGVVAVNFRVYKGEEMSLVEDITHYIEVQ